MELYCRPKRASYLIPDPKVLYPETLPVRRASWYLKDDATFIDALRSTASLAVAAVRSHLWRTVNCSTSAQEADMILIPQPALVALLEAACYST